MSVKLKSWPLIVEADFGICWIKLHRVYTYKNGFADLSDLQASGVSVTGDPFEMGSN